MYLAAMQKPSYRTIARFRTQFFDELVPLFEQIVQICHDLDLVGLNHIAFDGTKIKANASLKKTKSAKQLEKRILKLLRISARTDEEEDELFGTGSPFLIPEELANDEARYLLEIVEARCRRGSTIFCSQFDIQGWHQKISNEMIADAIVNAVFKIHKCGRFKNPQKPNLG